jgi:hypothetical protein
VLCSILKNLDHALNARRAYFAQQVIFFEVLLALLGCQFTTMQQLAANIRAMFPGKLFHKLPCCFQIGQFHGRSIFSAASTMPHSQGRHIMPAHGKINGIPVAIS